MTYFVQIAQIIISVTLITLIVLQSKGVGLGRAFGGSGEFYKSKRGIEKIVFRLTIFFASLFLFISIVNLVIY